MVPLKVLQLNILSVKSILGDRALFSFLSFISLKNEKNLVNALEPSTKGHLGGTPVCIFQLFFIVSYLK